MRVSSLPPVLPPGRIFDLLQSRVVVPMIALDGDLPAAELPTFLLAPAEAEAEAEAEADDGATASPGPSRSPASLAPSASPDPLGMPHPAASRQPSAPPGLPDWEGFPRLIGEIARVARLEAVRPVGASRYSVDLPQIPRGWLLDRTLLWTFLAGMWGRPQSPGGMQPPRRVDSSELLSLDPGDVPWTVRLKPDPDTEAGGEISWLLLEQRSGDSRRDDAHPRPSHSVATAAQRIRDHLRAAGWARAAASVHPQDHAAIRGGSGMMRLDGDGFRAYWPVRSFQRILTLLAAAAPSSVPGPGDEPGSESRADTASRAGETSRAGAAAWNALQIRALLGLIDAELRGWGLLRIVQMHPRTETEKRSRAAVRTVVELIRADGTPRRSLVDSAYRDGEAYQAAAVLVGWCSPAQRRALRAAFGPRRWEQLADHAVRRPPSQSAGLVRVPVVGASGEDPRYPWNAVALAAEHLVRRLAARVEQPGRRPPAATVEIIRRAYIDVRSQRLKAVLQGQIERGVLEQLLEEVFLSQLRRDLPRLPREVLVLAATGETPAVRDRLAAVFSRRGREIFREDIAAVERAIERGDFSDWDRVLAARQRVWGLYSGSARSRSRISPA